MEPAARRLGVPMHRLNGLNGRRTGRAGLAPTDFEWLGPKKPDSAPDGPCDLISFLRAALLECAGSPRLHGYEDFDPIRERLLEGVALF
jgi:hypothetical protein